MAVISETPPDALKAYNLARQIFVGVESRPEYVPRNTNIITEALLTVATEGGVLAAFGASAHFYLSPASLWAKDEGYGGPNPEKALAVARFGAQKNTDEQAVLEYARVAHFNYAELEEPELRETRNESLELLEKLYRGPPDQSRTLVDRTLVAFQLGLMLETNGTEYGQLADLTRARQYLGAAADAGKAETKADAHFELYIFDMKGWGTRQEDTVSALSHLMEASRLGNGRATANIAGGLWTGSNGFPEDKARGLHMYELAVQQGSKRAANVLATMYRMGLDGFKVDLEQAAYYEAIRDASESPF